MIDSIYNLLFHCRHKRTSFPLSLTSESGAGDMYVVCLTCGKQFHYDWKRMRIGTPIAAPSSKAAKSKVRYLAAACALPVLWLAGRAALGRPRSHSRKEQKPESER
jgi:hypothetical protein